MHLLSLFLCINIILAMSQLWLTHCGMDTCQHHQHHLCRRGKTEAKSYWSYTVPLCQAMGGGEVETPLVCCDQVEKRWSKFILTRIISEWVDFLVKAPAVPFPSGQAHWAGIVRHNMTRLHFQALAADFLSSLSTTHTLLPLLPGQEQEWSGKAQEVWPNGKFLLSCRRLCHSELGRDTAWGWRGACRAVLSTPRMSHCACSAQAGGRLEFIAGTEAGEQADLLQVEKKCCFKGNYDSW